MGTLLSSLDIALSGLQTAQIQLDIAAHNIANVNTEGYSRQRATIVARKSLERSYGQLGQGVEVTDVQRIRDLFLDRVYRQQTGGLGAAEVRASYFTQLETLFTDSDTSGLSIEINDFFDSLSDFANDVETQSVRTSVLTEAQSLASTLNQTANQIGTLRVNANEEAVSIVSKINSVAERLAALNGSITASEVGGTTANDLRDERDRLVDELSGLVNIQYQEDADGQVSITIDGDTLVERNHYKALAAVRDSTIDEDHPDFVTIQFAESGNAVNVTNGELYGALQARDVDLVEAGDRLDRIAATIIEQVNKIQSTGNGLKDLSGQITSSNAVDDTTVSLQSAGLPFDVTNGSFDVIVYDAAGTPTTTTITIDATTTLDSLVTDLNAIANFSATVTADNKLQLGAASGYTYSFANDSANALTALGVNVLFTGNDAGSIGVNENLVDNPELLTSGYSTNINETGDNTAALAMANVRSLKILDGDTATINDYYEATVVLVGSNTNANSNRLQIQQSFVDDFQKKRDEASGVSLDEETTNLLLYQRAYEASARIMTVVDNMLTALFNAVG